MNNTLVIYDTTGRIWVQMSGDVVAPVGVPFLWVDVPDGKILTGVDITVTPNVPIFVDYPISEIEKLQADIYYIAMMGGIEL